MTGISQDAVWRAPSRPREEPCRECGAAAPCGMDGAWWCVRHAPLAYWPRNLASAAHVVDDVGDVL